MKSAFFSIAGLICLAIFFVMQFFSYLYVNNTKRKARLIELAFGIKNKWAQGMRISFFDSSYLFSLMGNAIFNMRFRSSLGKPLIRQALFPYLHQENNYIKMWEEFRFYTVWNLLSQGIGILGFLCLGVMYGTDKGWF